MMIIIMTCSCNSGNQKFLRHCSHQCSSLSFESQNTFFIMMMMMMMMMMMIIRMLMMKTMMSNDDLSSSLDWSGLLARVFRAARVSAERL